MFDGFYHSKRVLVTGHTGFKGAWLCQWLLSLGAEVAGVSKDIPTDPALFDVLRLQDHIQDHRLDIRQYDPLLSVLQDFQPEVVFHLAAQPIVSEAYNDPVATYATNLMGTVHMLEAVKHTPSVKQLVMITSDKCYHNVEWHYGYREDDRLGGKDPYSASKACAEIAIHSYWQSFYRHSNTVLVSARAGNVIGGGDWAASRVVPDCMRMWSEDRCIDLRSPQATRPWQHVLEPLSGYLWLAVCGARDHGLSGEAFNFGPDPKNNHSVLSLVECMKQHWPDSQLTITPTTNDMHEAGLLKLCCDKAQHALHWSAVCSIEETVSMTVHWYRHFYQQSMDMNAFTHEQIQAYQQYAIKRGMPWTSQAAQVNKVCV